MVGNVHESRDECWMICQDALEDQEGLRNAAQLFRLSGHRGQLLASKMHVAETVQVHTTTPTPQLRPSSARPPRCSLRIKYHDWPWLPPFWTCRSCINMKILRVCWLLARQATFATTQLGKFNYLEPVEVSYDARF